MIISLPGLGITLNAEVFAITRGDLEDFRVEHRGRLSGPSRKPAQGQGPGATFSAPRIGLTPVDTQVARARTANNTL